MGPEIEKKSQNLLNIEQLEFLLSEIKDSYSPDSNDTPIIASVASDAASCDPQKTNTGALFCYNLQPLSQEQSTSIAHVSQAKNGRVTEKEIETPKTIASQAEKQNIKIIYTCTDGDPKTNILHKNFIDYLSKFPEKDFSSLIQYANQYKELIPVSDWLHILKNIRSRLIRHLIYLSENHELNIKKSEKGDHFAYNKKVAYSMRDDLALHIFNTINLDMSLDKKDYDEFIFILPFVLTTVVIQSNTLSVKARLDLLELSYQLIDVLSEIFESFVSHLFGFFHMEFLRYLYINLLTFN